MTTPSIKKNYIFNIINQLVNVLSPLITAPYISRVLGVEKVGINSYTSANLTYFTLVGMLGISGYGQQRIAMCRDNRRETSQSFWELQTLHVLIMIPVFIAYIFLIIYSPKYSMYYAVNIISLIACLFDINWLYYGFEKYQFISIRNYIIKIISVCLILLLINSQSDIFLYIGLTDATALAANLILWIHLKDIVDFRGLKRINIKRHIKDTLIFFIPTIAASVYSVLDKSVINWITHSESENGYYEQAWKILMIFDSAIQALSVVTAPRMANLYAKGNIGEVRKRINHSFEFLLFIAFPCAFGMASIANRFVPVFFGSGYEGVIPILYVFMPLIVIQGTSVYIDGLYLVPTGKRFQSALIVCFGSGINFFLNIFMVLKFSALGAAIATLLTETFITSAMMALGKTIIDWNKFWHLFFKYLSFSFFMAVVIVILNHFVIPYNLFGLIIDILIGVGIYILLCTLFKDRMFYELLNFIKIKLRITW